tara:strand:- start:144 stop:497 length:354 start_codon:yes stop_codon:yes gene_type:complete
MTTEIYNIVKARITTNNLEAFKSQAKRMTEASKGEPGTLVYDFFLNEEAREVLIVEKYADGQSFMKHMRKFTQPEFIPKILEMQEIISIEMPGKLTNEIEELFSLGGWPYNSYPAKV